MPDTLWVWPDMKWYRRNGQPYREPYPKSDTPEWRQMMQEVEADLKDPAKKRVAEDTTLYGLWISTVWLGLDHQFGDGPPMIFETMVFLNKNRLAEIGMRRYSTEEEALRGHREMVEKWRYHPLLDGCLEDSNDC